MAASSGTDAEVDTMGAGRAMRKDKERHRLVEQARRYLEAAGRPRLVMLGVLGVTLAAGFLASVAMVHIGIGRMAVRYPLAVAVAYATFLGMLRWWLRRQDFATQLEEDPEGLLLPGAAAFGTAALAAKQAVQEVERRPEQSTSEKGSGVDLGGLGDIGSGGDLVDGLGCLVILVLIAGLCTLIVSIYLVATSPLLLAELLVDGALLGALTRAAGPEPPPHWSRSVVRRTWIAAMVTAIVFGLVGWGIERVAPGAHTLAEAWRIDRAR